MAQLLVTLAPQDEHDFVFDLRAAGFVQVEQGTVGIAMSLGWIKKASLFCVVGVAVNIT